jgi:NAD(P)-dependent dehydrogenase (short-subunit alcohol dehydrogenase family)
MMGTLANQIALVTGASSGIGRAIAVALAAAGARVGLVARDAGALAEVAREIGGGAFVLPCDLADDEQIGGLPDRIVAQAGPVDILVHSAAVYFQKPLETAPVEEFDLQYRINLRAPYLLTQKLLRQLKERRGQVVFINSSTGVNARPTVTQYAAVKHGLKGLADALRMEVVSAGVRVISLYPGQTATPMQEHRHALENKAYQPEKLIQPVDVAAALVTAIAMPRNAVITDLHIRPAGN